MGVEGRDKELEGAKKIVECVDRKFEWLGWYELDRVYYVKVFIWKTKKVLIKSKEEMLEVFKKLEWYIAVVDKFPDENCNLMTRANKITRFTIDTACISVESETKVIDTSYPILILKPEVDSWCKSKGFKRSIGYPPLRFRL